MVSLAQKYGCPIFCTIKHNFGGNVHSRQDENKALVLYSHQASNFLTNILPYLRLKYSQACIGIEFQSKRVQGNHGNSRKVRVKEEGKSYQQCKNLKAEVYSPLLERNELYKTDLYYLAGFIDADGCIHITKHKVPGLDPPYVHELLVTIAQSNQRPFLGGIKKIFGGSIQSKKLVDLDTLYLYSNKALKLLLLIKNSLQLKSKQANLGIEFQSGKRITGLKRPPERLLYEKKAYLKMASLNGRYIGSWRLLRNDSMRQMQEDNKYE